MNIGFTGKGNVSLPGPLIEQVKAGAIGLKLHEDWGTTPAAIDNCLSVADDYDVQVAIHTDTLNESGFVETTLAAFKNRTIHTYHTEGAGGGHAPDIIKVLMVCHRPGPEHRRRRGLRGKPHTPRDHCCRRHSCTTWARFRCSAPTARPWAGLAK